MTPDLSSPSRRRFIKTFMLGSAVSLLDGQPWQARLLAEVSTGQASGDILPVRISQFPALKNEFGSVRLKLNPSSGDFPNGQFYPVVVTRGIGDAFYAVSTACTHAGCIVGAYSTVTNSMYCLCHGSQYDVDGSLLAGPAPSSLQRYNLTFDGVDLLCIEVPGLGLKVRKVTALAGTGGSPRLKLDVQTIQNGKYQVAYRAQLSDAPQVASFATTVGGAATNTSFNGNGSVMTVYVDGTSDKGFYSLVLLIANG
ncbi:MAG TPA: Rieske 2Fe-2S domain-containing protein [Verrucomicrobiae bacterium]|jgi:Rieske Fe-S protein